MVTSLFTFPRSSQVEKRGLFKMDFSPIKEMYLFEGKKDTTFNEIRTWKGVFFSVLSASEVYLETLHDAVKCLRGVSSSDTDKDAIRGSSQGTASALSDMLTQISDLQKNVLDGMETFRDSQGPLAELNRMNSIGFKSQADTSRSIVKDHKELETKALKALKKYERRVTERETLDNPRPGTFSWNDLCCVSYRRNTISQKVDAARLYFAIQSRREITHREVVVQLTGNLKLEFLKEERKKLEALFSTISVVWSKIGNVVPYQIRRTEQKGILPKDPNTLAKLGWEVRLQLYKFPEYQVDKNNIKLGKEIQEILDNVTQHSTREAAATGDTDLRGLELNKSGNALSSKKQQKTDLPSKEARSSFFSGELHPDGDDVQRAFARKRSTLGKRETTYVLMKPTKAAPSASSTTLAAATASASTATASSSGASVSALVGMAKTINSASLIKNSSLMKQSTPSGDTKVNRRPDSADGTRPDPEQELDPNCQKGQVHLQADDKSRSSLTSKTCKKEEKATKNTKLKHGFFMRIFSRSKGSKPASSINTPKTAMTSIKNRPKQNANEISLREGMKIKMTQPENSDGMVYGYKRSKLGLKKYGYFPGNAVVYLSPTGN